MKKIFYVCLLCCAAVACTLEDEMEDVVEIGATAEDVNLDCGAGTYALQVLSDGEWTAAVTSGSNWLSFRDGTGTFSGNGDSEVILSYGINKGMARDAVVTLTRKQKTREVAFVQEGIISSGLKFSGRNVSAAASGGVISAKIITPFSDDELLYEISYGETGGWINSVSKQNNFIVFNVEQNLLETARTAVIKVSFRENASVSDELYVSQTGAGTVCEQISFSRLKSLPGSEDEIVIDSDYLLSGRVVNDNLEGNGSEVRNISAVLKDTERASRVVYLQDLDGSNGVMLEMKTVQDNTLERYDRVTVNLRGLTLTRRPATASEPLRYELSGARVANIISSEGGSLYDLPVKEKRLAELTDEDVYTFVTLTDCEIPIRKGPFVPVDLRYTAAMNKYPMPVRDIDGSSSFLISNLDCAWARDGQGMPEGSGKISGVIVHEKCDNFEWDKDAAGKMTAAGVADDYVTGVGTLSRYQIRPVAKSDIALSQNVGDGFSGMLMEIRYVNRSYDNIVKNVDASWTAFSTWPASPYPLNDPKVKGRMYRWNAGHQEQFLPWRDWTHLGPVSGGVITNPSGGNGVTDYYGAQAHWNIYASTSTSGLIIDSNGSAWYCSKWTTEQSWVAVFSTEGLTQAAFPLSVNFGAENGLGETVGAPRYWTVEYSTDGSSWSRVADYTVPDFPIIYNKRQWQCPAFKYFTFNLPQDPALLDREQVYIRMHPSGTTAGTSGTYDSGTVVSSCQSALNYFSIRYNK